MSSPGNINVSWVAHRAMATNGAIMRLGIVEVDQGNFMP
jgi:hypothetical protein